MSSIDERVVNMKFNNAQFQSGIQSTLSSLEKLKANLNLSGAAKGLDGLGAAAKNVNLSNIAAGVDNLASKFSNLGIIGITALTNIANKAVNAGLSLVKSLTIAPISEGFNDYNAKLTSVQTIMNATGASIQKVDGYFKQLDEYADKTIYNLSDMTGAFAKFTNAGLDMSVSVPAIKGIANMVALAGQGADAASIAMYNLSQSIAGGFLTTTDYKSLNLANVATKEWKDQMIAGAVAAGTLTKNSKGMYTIKGGKKAYTDASLFADALSEGWASADVLTTVLGDYGDATTKIGKKALAAAQNVKSLPMMMDTLKASVGTGWTDTFELLFGNVTEATKLWTGLTNTISGFISASTMARNAPLSDWKKYGGRTALIDGFKNAFQALMSVLGPISEAFKKVFPPATGRTLREMSVAFRDFFKGLILGKENMDRLKRTFTGIFSVFSIVWTIVKGVASGFMSLFGIVGHGTGGFLALTATVGDFLTKINDWLVKSGAIKGFFDAINAGREAVMVPLVNVISKVAQAIAALVHGDISGFKELMAGAFSGVLTLVDAVRAKFDTLLGTISKLSTSAGTYLTGLRDKVTGGFSGLAEAVITPLMAMFENIGASVEMLKAKFVNLIPKLDTSGLKGVTGNLSGLSVVAERSQKVWDGLVNAFNNVKDAIAPVTDRIGQVFAVIADKIIEYVKGLDMQDAVALLNTGFFIAMYIALKKFFDNLGGMWEEIKGTWTDIRGTFSQLTDTLKTMQNSVKAKIILEIAIAVGILAAALFVLAGLDPKKLGTALAAVGVLLAAITLSMSSMIKTLKVMEGTAPASAARILAAGGAMMLLAAAVLMLSHAVQNLSGLSWTELSKGLIGVGMLLGALTLFTQYAKVNEGGLAQGAGLILLAIAIRLLASSVSVLGNMDLGTLTKGIIALGVILFALSQMIKSMDDTTGIVKAAAGMLILSVALMALSLTIRVFAAIDYATMIKGLLLMVITLRTLGGAMSTFPPNMPATAAGLLMVSVALVIIAKALQMIGSMSIGALVKSIVTLALALGIIVIAVNLMVGAMPGAQALLVVSAALFIFANVMKILGGLSWEAIGKGLVAIVAVLVILGVAGLVMAPVVPVILLLGIALGLLGAAMLLAGVGFLAFATGFALLAAVGAAGFLVLITGFQGLMALIPMFAQQIALGLIAFAKVISDAGPVMVAALTTILLSLLRAIDNVMPKFFDTMGRLIMGLVNKVAELAPKIYDAGLKMILGFLAALDGKVYMIVRITLDIIARFLKGIGDGLPGIIKAGTNLIVNFIKGIGDAALKIATAALDTITKFVAGLAVAIRTNTDALNRAGGDLASAIISGFVKGLVNIPASVAKAGWNMAKAALDAAASALDSNSPSKEFEKLGLYANQGFAKGLVGGLGLVKSSLATMGSLIKNTIASTAKDVAAAQKKLAIVQGTKRSTKSQKSQAAASLRQSQILHANALKADIAFNKWLGTQKAGLLKLGASYDVLAGKLKTANEALVEAKKIQSEFAKTTAGNFDTLPEIDPKTNVLSYSNALKRETAANNKFRDSLANLRKMGMDDTTYNKLLAEGVEVQPFLDKLINGGPEGVKNLNDLNAQLAASATSLGVQASKDLYQAGVDAAQGLVNGLSMSQKAIEMQMTKLAAAMVASIKRQLGIKSPSRVFMEIGKYSNEGLAKGLNKYSGVVEKSASGVGTSAIDAMRKSISGMSKLITADIDTTPVIRPILDLTTMQKDALKIDSLLNTKPMSVDAAYSTAKDASAGYRRNHEIFAQQASDRSSGQDNLTFIQNNNSPRALSQAEIYRQTKNQLSKAKGALTN